MKGFLASLAVCVIIALAFIGSIPSHAFNAVTTTVVGWDVPSATTMTNGVAAFLFPIVITGFLVGIAVVLGNRGASNSLLIKVGLFAGGFLGMLSLTATNANIIPYALPVVGAVYLITYLWKDV